MKEFSLIGVKNDLSITHVDVVTDVTIQEIVNIFVKESSIGFKFNISLMWSEKQRNFQNLKNDLLINKLSAAEKNNFGF